MYPKQGAPQDAVYLQAGAPPPEPSFHGPINSDRERLDDGAKNVDCEQGADKMFDFTEQSIRKGFIRKVYSILMVQLLITLSFVCLFVFHEPTKIFVNNNAWTFWVAFGTVLVCLLAIALSSSVRRKVPLNFIFLGTFTVAESFLLGVISGIYDSQVVLLAVGITAAVCFALTLFAFQTKWDFTTIGGLLVSLICVLLLFGIMSIFFYSNVLSLIYAAVGALIFSLYLVYDTQLMMGGQHQYTITPEEYVFAALNLYLDIIQLFLFILRIVGAISR